MKETWSDTIKQMVKKAGKGKILLLIAVGVLLLLVSIKDSGLFTYPAPLYKESREI